MVDGAVDGPRFLSFLDNHLVRKAEARTIVALTEAALAAKAAITFDDLAGYFSHAGYGAAA